jgi:hypothetical protein
MFRAFVRAVLDRLAGRIAARLPAGSGAVLVERALLLAAKQCAARARALPDAAPLADAEFKVFSQWGEDGILQFLVSRVPAPSRTFVEFGTQDYSEANTRFLLINDNWRGLLIDGSERDIARIRSDSIYWRHDLEAVCAFVTRENINGLIAPRFPGEELGLLSVDIDGNDYWVWQAITCVRPSIVVCEYNSVFGNRLAVTVPYRADFDRAAAHHSNLYYGASLPALCRLAEEKGYALVGTNTAGNNAFFVRKDRLGGLGTQSAAQAYVESKYRESRDASGALSYLAGLERLRAIQELPLVELASGASRPIRELFADELALGA